jgi:predicted lipid-binding transport protein (Tim44 family)
MFRTILGYAVLAIVGIIALKLIFGLIGVVFSLLWVVLWLAFLGFVFYLILKVISPRTAQRVKDSIKGTPSGD